MKTKLFLLTGILMLLSVFGCYAQTETVTPEPLQMVYLTSITEDFPDMDAPAVAAPQSESVVVPGIPENTAPSILTLLGIVALASVIVTQLMKVIPTVKRQNLLKYAISIAVGIALSFLGWWLNLTAELSNLAWYWVLAHGVFAGIAASGGYGFIKSLWKSFPKTVDIDPEYEDY